MYKRYLRGDTDDIVKRAIRETGWLESQKCFYSY